MSMQTHSLTRRVVALLLAWTVPGVAGAADPASGSTLVVGGRVFSDATGLPLAARVRVSGSAEPAVAADAEGRFAAAVPESGGVLVIEAEGYVSVDRAVGGGAVGRVLDARLSPLASPVTVGPLGGDLAAGGLRVTVPRGRVEADTGFVLTALSAQGLPGRLPLGWAPVVAFDLRAGRAGRAVPGPFPVVYSGLPSGALHLAVYSQAEHVWTLVSTHGAGAEGGLATSLPELGAYALLRADEGELSPPAPSAGQPIEGVEAASPPPGMIGSAVVVPAQVPATGATALGKVTLTSPSGLPSGTLVEARLTETFTLEGAQYWDEERRQDVLVHRASPRRGGTLLAEVPLTARQTFDNTQPVHGRLHLEVWTARPLGGGTPGGHDAVTVDSGNARVRVESGSLPQNTLVSLQAVGPSAFLPQGPDFSWLGEVVLDLSGATLTPDAELSLLLPGASSTASYVIARVERRDGVPYLTAVSLAEVVGERVVSRAYPGLAGIKSGGRYVFYRLSSPVGFVSGATRTASGPVGAVVETEGWPFVGLASALGGYITAAPVGSEVKLRATVPRTPLAAEATVAVAARATTTLNLTLTGDVTTVDVSPADGSTAVSVSTTVQITASQALEPASATADHVRLFRGVPSASQPVVTRLVLSADERTLSVIPEAPLEPATAYTLRVTDLRDAFGGAVLFPDVRFTTRSDTQPSYDLNQIVFSFPNPEDGLVEVKAKAGSLPPGSTLLIVNSGNGVVLSLDVDNDGGLSGKLPAGLDDEMLLTLTDPLGRVMTGRQSRFVDVSTGRTAIGRAGGVVEGKGGVELRLPPGATERGVILKAEALAPESIPLAEWPSLPGSALGGVLAITSADKPAFKKEVDLAFPKPADAPADAFFYVYRRIQGPGGKVLHQALDSASLEGDKVVTNSPPFSGYRDSLGRLSLGLGGGMGIEAVETTSLLLMWTYDSLQPRRAQAALVTGKVLCRVWDPSTRDYAYLPVPGAVVRRVDGNHDPVEEGGTTAVTGPDGTYAFFDPLFTDGLVTVRATLPVGTPGACKPETREATGYGVPKPPWASAYRALATANVTFTAPEAPAPPPTLEIRILKKAAGKWTFSNGLELAGTPLRLGFTTANARLVRASVSGEVVDLREGGEDTLGLQKVADYTPVIPGVFTVEATAEPSMGPSFTVSRSFLVIAEGDSNNTIRPDEPPRVISSVPRGGGSGVPVTIYPEVSFTEPVRNVPGNVTLHDLNPDLTLGPAVSFSLLGNGPDGPLASLTGASTVSSLTLKPASSLKHGTKYRLTLTDAVVDLDSGQPSDPKKLVPFAADFETFEAGTVGESEDRFHAAGLVVLEDRAYVVENVFTHGILRTYDASDPVNLVEVGKRTQVTGRPVDIAGEAASPANDGQRLVAIATTTAARSRPSNVHLFDVAGDQPRLVGAASVSASAVEGTLQRLVLHHGMGYALTWRKGLQVVDLKRTISNYASTDDLSAQIAMNTDGVGFGRDAVVVTIPVLKAPGLHWLMQDLKVGDYFVEGQNQPMVWATGDLGLVLANPQTGTHRSPVPIRASGGANKLATGYALALGRLGTKDVAVVVGDGEVKEGADTIKGPVLAVVDLTNPLSPRTLAIVPLNREPYALDGLPSDVVLVSSQFAVVAGPKNAVVVDLGTGESAGTAPVVVGAIEGLGGRLSVDSNGLLFGTAHSVFGGSDPLGGVRTAALGSVGFVKDVSPAMVQVDTEGKSTEPMTVTYRFIAPPDDVGNVDVTVSRNAQLLGRYPVEKVTAGEFKMTIPAGLPFAPPPERVEISVLGSDGSRSAPLATMIEDAEVVKATSAIAASPAFDEVTPRSLPARGTGLAPRLKITGKNLFAMSQVMARGPESEWTTITPVARDLVSVTIDLPSALAAVPGFVLLSPTGVESDSLALLVSDPTLPARGTASGVTMSAIDPTELTLEDRVLTVTGDGFADGMSVVIGRDSGGAAFPTTVVSSNEIGAELPGPVGRADDLYVAVLAADRLSLSASLPLKSKLESAPIDYPSIVPPGRATLTAIAGPITWTLGEGGEEQELDLEGVGIGPGTQVLFKSQGRSVTRTARAARGTLPPTPPGVARVTVDIPKDFNAWPSYVVALEPQRPKLFATPGRRYIGVLQRVTIPLGGRRKLAGYRRPGDEKLYVVSYPDPAAGVLICPDSLPTWTRLAALKQPPTRLTGGQRFEGLDSSSYLSFRVSSPEIEHPFNTGQVPSPGRPVVALAKIPLVSREANGCELDPTDVGYYLRGERLPKGDDYATVTASATDSKGNPLWASFTVTVGKVALGQAAATAEIEEAILDAAGEAGVPPQFLKAQVAKETHFKYERYRYEPMTIDFEVIGRDGAALRSNPYVARHLRQGNAAAATDAEECVVILGPNAAPAAADTQGCRTPFVQATAGQKEFPAVAGEPAVTPVRGRRGMPLIARQPNPNYRVVEVQAIRALAPSPPPPPPPPTPTPTPCNLNFVEAPYWSLAQNRAPQGVADDDFQFEYATNTLTLGRALGQGEWIKLSYHKLREDGVSPGACGAYDVNKLNGRTQKIGRVYQQFAPEHTIGTWITTNTRAGFKGFNWLNGTDSEEHIEFYSRDGGHPGASNPQLIDKRLDLATAQFVAAGSFGLTQATTIAWDHARAPVLNAVFNLKDRCLTELGEGTNADRYKEALRYAAAYHSYHAYGPGAVPRTTLPGRRWDHLEWARYWSKVLNFFNPGPEYCAQCKNATEGISSIIQLGRGEYAPK